MTNIKIIIDIEKDKDTSNTRIIETLKDYIEKFCKYHFWKSAKVNVKIEENK